MATCKICGCALGVNFRGKDLPCAYCGAFAKDSELKRKRPEFKLLFTPEREKEPKVTPDEKKARKKKHYQNNREEYKARQKQRLSTEEAKRRQSEAVKRKYHTDPDYKRKVNERAMARYWKKRSES